MFPKGESDKFTAVITCSVKLFSKLSSVYSALSAHNDLEIFQTKQTQGLWCKNSTQGQRPRDSHRRQ